MESLVAFQFANFLEIVAGDSRIPISVIHFDNKTKLLIDNRHDAAAATY